MDEPTTKCNSTYTKFCLLSFVCRILNLHHNTLLQVFDRKKRQPNHKSSPDSDRARLLDHEDPDDTNVYGTFNGDPRGRPVSPALPSDVAAKVSSLLLCTS